MSLPTHTQQKYATRYSIYFESEVFLPFVAEQQKIYTWIVGYTNNAIVKGSSVYML